MRHRLALLFAVLIIVLLASLGPVGPAGADDDDVDPQTIYPLTSFPPPTATTWSCSGTTRLWSASGRSGPRRRSTPGPCSSSTARPMTPGRPMTRRPPGPGWATACVGRATEWTTANKSQAISHAAYRAASSVWPGCQASWDAQLDALGYSTGDATAAATVGRRAADAVIAHRTNDGANQAGGYADTSGYTPVNPPAPASLVDPWRWQAQGCGPGAGPALAQW